MFCIKCGTEVVEELPSADFCRICGARLPALTNEYEASPALKEEARGKYAKHILFGALWAGGGTIVTLATLSAAEGGGTYIIAWGAIVFGVLEILYGVIG